MHFCTFFFFDLSPLDPDPCGKLNADPDPQPEYGEGGGGEVEVSKLRK